MKRQRYQTERHTSLEPVGNHPIITDARLYNKAVAKLHFLEDFEQKCHTDLAVLCAAKLAGVYRIMADDEIVYFPPSEITVYIDHICTESGAELYMWSYEEDWALTETALRNVVKQKSKKTTPKEK